MVICLLVLSVNIFLLSTKDCDKSITEEDYNRLSYNIVNFDSFCTINAPAPRFSALMGGLDEVHPSSGRCILGHSHQEF